VDVTAQPGQAIGRDIRRGEIVEAEIDASISKRHGQRVKAKGERTEERPPGVSPSGAITPPETPGCAWSGPIPPRPGGALQDRPRLPRELPRDRSRKVSTRRKEVGMNEQEIRKGLESGKLHPFPPLQHLAREEDQESARFVAEMGPEYLQGGERLKFRSLVRELLPEALETEDAQRGGRSERKRQERTTALGDSLVAVNAAEREGREGRPLPTGGGWNLPSAV